MNERLAYSPNISASQAPRKRLRPSDVLVRAATCELLRQEERPLIRLKAADVLNEQMSDAELHAI